MTTISSRADLKRGIDFLCQTDPRFAEVFALTGLPPLRRRSGGFAALLQIVVGQQVSKASASAIWNRLASTLGPVTAERFRHFDEDTLRSVGLSGPKVRTVQAVVEAVQSDRLRLSRLSRMSDEAVHEHLVQVKGIGPWTADIYLLACLGRPDAWPAGDLAIQIATQEAFGLEERPDARSLRQFSEPWSPWRGVAARLLWAYYAHKRSRDVMP